MKTKENKKICFVQMNTCVGTTDCGKIIIEKKTHQDIPHRGKGKHKTKKLYVYSLSEQKHTCLLGEEWVRNSSKKKKPRRPCERATEEIDSCGDEYLGEKRKREKTVLKTDKTQKKKSLK